MSTNNGLLFDAGFAANIDFDEYTTGSRSPSESINALVGTEFDFSVFQKLSSVTPFSTRDGFEIFDAKEDFYERIWINPTAIDLGIVSRNIDYSISIWNAFSTSKTLTEITDSGDVDGISFGSITPLAFLPAE